MAELEAFKVDRSSNINKDIPLGALLLTWPSGDAHMPTEPASTVGKISLLLPDPASLQSISLNAYDVCGCSSCVHAGRQALLREARTQHWRGARLPQVPLKYVAWCTALKPCRCFRAHLSLRLAHLSGCCRV